MLRDAAAQPWQAHFSDPEAVTRYAEGPPRFVPGYADLHRMTRILLAERAAPDAQVLVLDEPTNGLDPQARIEMRELLLRLASLGVFKLPPTSSPSANPVLFLG